MHIEKLSACLMLNESFRNRNFSGFSFNLFMNVVNTGSVSDCVTKHCWLHDIQTDSINLLIGFDRENADGRKAF